MGHPNYNYLLGQIRFRPSVINNKYSDEMFDAFPISSTFDLSSDVKYREFLIIYQGNSDIVKISPRDICLSNTYTDTFIKYNDALRNNIVDSFETYNSGYERDFGANVGLGFAMNLPSYKSVLCFLYTRSHILFVFPKGYGGHTHQYQPVKIEEITIKNHSWWDNEQDKVSCFSFKDFFVSTDTTMWLKSGYPNQRDGGLNRMNFTYSYYTERCMINREDITDNKQYPNLKTITNITRLYKTIIGKGYNILGAFPVFEDSIFINKDTKTQIMEYYYSNYEGTISGSTNEYSAYNTQTMHQCSLGTNMLLVTSVNRNKFTPDDEYYLKSLIGDIFFGVLPFEFYKNCKSLEILPLHEINILKKIDYPDFFDVYGIETETIAGKDLWTIIDNNNILNNDFFCYYYQAQNKEDIGKTFKPQFDKNLKDIMDFYLPHEVYIPTKYPKTTKVVPAHENPQNNIKVLKVTGVGNPKKTIASYTHEVINNDYLVDFQYNPTSGKTEKVWGPTPAKGFAPFPYVILKYKL